jgi:hypothetical protein
MGYNPRLVSRCLSHLVASPCRCEAFSEFYSKRNDPVLNNRLSSRSSLIGLGVQIRGGSAAVETQRILTRLGSRPNGRTAAPFQPHSSEVVELLLEWWLDLLLCP